MADTVKSVKEKIEATYKSQHVDYKFGRFSLAEDSGSQDEIETPRYSPVV